MADEGQRLPATPGSPAAAESGPEITPELVRQVAEKVYALWLRDLKIARERKKHG